MIETQEFDAIIVGSGQGGKPFAVAMAEAGKKTALVERRYVGGTCVNTGCSPTKTMVASARVAYMAGRAKDYGVSTGKIAVDIKVVRERKRAIVEKFRKSGEELLEKAGVHLIRGEASFTDPHSLSVTLNEGGEMKMRAGLIVIDTGVRPALPPVEGLDGIPFLDNESIMELDSLPEHLLVLGGGYIGLEFAQMFRRFGSRVTIVQGGAQLLPREDGDIAKEILTILQQDGIDVRLNTHAKRATKSNDGIDLELLQGDSPAVVHGSHLLLATGRTPNTEVLKLPAAGIKTDKHGFVQVNEKLETSAAGVYAIGDANGGPEFTHISYDDYRILKTNLLEGGSRTTRGRMVPYTVFIDPQLGRIGLTEAEARSSGMKVRVTSMPMSSVARALEIDEKRGVIKIVVDASTDQIAGAAVLGYEGGELVAVIETTMMGGLKYTALRDGIFAHPTLAESLNNVFSHFRDEN